MSTIHIELLGATRSNVGAASVKFVVVVVVVVALAVARGFKPTLFLSVLEMKMRMGVISNHR